MVLFSKSGAKDSSIDIRIQTQRRRDVLPDSQDTASVEEEMCIVGKVSELTLDFIEIESCLFRSLLLWVVRPLLLLPRHVKVGRIARRQLFFLLLLILWLLWNLHLSFSTLQLQQLSSVCVQKFSFVLLKCVISRRVNSN